SSFVTSAMRFAFMIGYRELCSAADNFRFGGEREPFVEPAGDTADHHLHRQPKPSEAQRGLVGTVAVRPSALDHEQFFFRKICNPRRGHLAVRDVDGSLDMSICERGRSTDID